MSVDLRHAVVLAPGGLPGIELGLAAWKAYQHTFRRNPDWIGGGSAGAVVGAMWASGMHFGAAESLLRGMQTTDLVQKRFAALARIAWLDSLYDAAPIERKLAEVLPSTWPCQIPLDIAATKRIRLTTEQQQAGMDDAVPRVFSALDQVSVRTAVRCSLSIGGIWPAVKLDDGANYLDAGYTMPYLLPDLSAFDRIFIFNPRRYSSFDDGRYTVVHELLWGIEQLQDEQMKRVRESLMPFADKLAWIDLDMRGVSCLKFSPSHDLINLGYQDAIAKLK